MKDLKMINDLEAIKAISNSFRLQILKVLEEEVEASATDIAKELDESASKVSYHLKILEKNDLISLVETRVKGNIVEKIYSPVAKEIQIELKKEETSDKIDDDMMLTFANNILSNLKEDLFKLADKISSPEENTSSTLSYSSYYLTEEEVEEIEEHVMSKLKEFKGRKKEDYGEEYKEYKIGFFLLDYLSKD